MPYRGRVVKRIKGQRKLKMNAPTAKFTLTKNYEVINGAAHSSVYMKRIQLASPFGVFHDVNNSSGASLGEWEANDEQNEPLGLNSELYRNYNYLVVKGCHVSASVNQAPDVDIPAEGDGSKQVLTTGQITLARTASELDAASIPTTAEMKQWFGQKTKNFQLGGTFATSQALTKNAYVSNGYSAKRQWNVNPNTKFDLQIQNKSGQEIDADDPTHMYVIVKPRKDIDASELPIYLKPMMITIKVSYIVQFQDPTNIQSVPLPMSFRKGGRKVRYSKAKQASYFPQYFATAGVGATGLAVRALRALAAQQMRQRALGWR